MKTPESMTDYLKLTDAQKMELAALPPVRSETLLAAANKLHNYLIHAPFCVHVPDDIWMPFDEALQEANSPISLKEEK